MTEDAYASAIFMLMKLKYMIWQVVPLQFLNALLAYLGDSISFDQHSSGSKSPLASQPSSCHFGTNTPLEGLIRWKLRLEYFAYETLQDLRIAKLFEIIVDYPESSPAIEDLKQCLEYAGQYSKLVESFLSALRYRLLTAGASTNDILHQYVSTIKALRTIDPAGFFLEACCAVKVVMLTCDSVSSFLFSWEADPVETDPLKDPESAAAGMSLENLDATIISSNFWTPIQACTSLISEEALIVPGSIDQLLSDYARRFHEIKTPRKLLWKKNLGTVKVSLTSKNLAAAIGIPVDVLNRRISSWISKFKFLGIFPCKYKLKVSRVLTESPGTDPSNHVFTLVEGMIDASKNSGNTGNCEELLAGEEEADRSVAIVEDQLKIHLGYAHKFGSMALDRIHNTLKMFCVADPPYDKSLQQLQSFLSDSKSMSVKASPALESPTFEFRQHLCK
ncbi:Detected protein of confused Function [Hibiscus syriacus]|uniref:Detected protein of confused Function n=1 Tax=Hibiscus syriacus TaxID=106335 RepID=A0A6A3CUZ7_HIBSY|nr:Detected protein of confused Function [Hibiscus syriacus]